MLSETDRYLVEKIRAGDYKAYETVFKSYFNYLFSVALGYVKSDEDAEDIVQDLFVKIWEQPCLLAANESLKWYLHKSISNSCINHILRKQNKTNRLDDTTISSLKKLLWVNEEDLADTGILFSEMDGALKNAVANLPAECHKIFVLSREEELPHKKIAMQLNISENTVKVQIYRALIKLREALKDYL
jgi:RNA polymerase sigma-70 factor (ECF subfamily)